MTIDRQRIIKIVKALVGKEIASIKTVLRETYVD